MPSEEMQKNNMPPSNLGHPIPKDAWQMQEDSCFINMYKSDK